MLKQPVGQKRLTNVAIVRLKHKGKRFEVAAYKNKVRDWRDGIEKDINEVLQIITVFTNVSKGDVASEQDLKKAFNTSKQEEVCRKILKSGDLQVSDRERELHMEGLFRDIVQIVVERCVHPQSGRQLTALTVESALRSIGFSTQPEQAAKKQALKAIESLCTEMPDTFTRAKMRLRITCPERLREEVRRYLVKLASAQIEGEIPAAEGDSITFTFLCDPSQYRQLDQLATVTHAGEGMTMQVITAAVISEGSDTLGGSNAQHPTSLRSGESLTAAVVQPQSAMASSCVAVGNCADAVRQNEQEARRGQPQKKGPKCSTCGGAVFEDATAYRQHCRSEWHNLNLKRKVKSLPPLTAEEFAEVSLDAQEGFLAVDA